LVLQNRDSTIIQDNPMPPIQLTNTATRAKERLQPLDPTCVRLYVCGPTVYDRAHIGNARPMIVFDILARLLRRVYGADHVIYARNITDIDDKIMTRAAETGRTVADITAETTAWFHEDMAALGVLPPDYEPRATEFVPQMITMIEGLIANGSAYVAAAHVLFSVRSFQQYGQLAKRSLDDMRAGARVDVAPYKQDPMDFVLWKPSHDDMPGWDSPWGKGRPGWHIECSAMSKAYLGESFDIHGGGIDLVFPHHENERAQSLCAHPGSEFAKIWMHNGFVQVNGEKMSKSLGNFITVADLRENSVSGEVIRMAMLTTHYRQPFDWNDALVEEVRTVLTKWRRLTAAVDIAPDVPEAVLAALADDLNTPKAIAALHAMANDGDYAGLKAGAEMIGLLTDSLGGWEAAPTTDAVTAARIDGLIAARSAARKAKDFAKSDIIRDSLIAAGVEIRDTPQGAKWSLCAGFDAEQLPEL
jgi:cysteinyl-tRNA synthetase